MSPDISGLIFLFLHLIKRLDYIVVAVTAFIFTLYHAVLTSLVIARIDSLNFSFGYIFFVECIAFIPVGLAMVIIMWLGKKYPRLFTTLSFETVSKHVLIAATIFVIHSFWQPYVTLFFFDRLYTFDRTVADFIAFLEMRFLIYVIIVGLVSGIIKIREQQDMIVKQSDLSLKLQKARLRELELKMNPEIIYPNLNYIREKAETHPESASQMVILMAGILRKLVDNMENEQAKLSDEANLFKKYTELLKLRLERPFEIEVKLPEKISGERVPSLILLTPLFEELFFGEYQIYTNSVDELIFEVEKISEAKFKATIELKNITNGPELSSKIKSKPIIRSIKKLLYDLPDGTFEFTPVVEKSGLILTLESDKKIMAGVDG